METRASSSLRHISHSRVAGSWSQEGAFSMHLSEEPGSCAQVFQASVRLLCALLLLPL